MIEGTMRGNFKRFFKKVSQRRCRLSWDLHDKHLLSEWALWERKLLLQRIELDQLKAALEEKCPELVNRRCSVSHQDTATPRFSDDQAETVTAWLRSSAPPAVFTRHCTFKCPFISVLTKFFSWEKIQFFGRLQKTPGTILFSKISKGFGKMDSWSCLKNGRR